jgi:Tfp pilus assembly protein PilE
MPFRRAQPGGDGWPAQRKAGFWLVAVMAVVAIITGTSGALIGQHQQHVRQVAAAAAASASAEASRKAEAERQADIDKAKHDFEVLTRKSSVSEIESSVKQMATQQAATGLFAGPIISVTCTPAAGSSLDDLDQATTDFGCFAATKDNGDGTLSGYNYHATMDWGSGQFTYGFGAE